jgi:hypothetical protein
MVIRKAVTQNNTIGNVEKAKILRSAEQCLKQKYCPILPNS